MSSQENIQIQDLQFVVDKCTFKGSQPCANDFQIN